MRDLALGKLRDERFNSEVAATLATLAPREHRQLVVRGIVAYEVMYDYLDALTEQPHADPLQAGRRAYKAFTDALTSSSAPSSSYYETPQSDGGYLDELAQTVRHTLENLPAAAAVRPVALRAAERCAEAQVRAHAASHSGRSQLEEWAREEVTDSAGWREFLAGAASSVLAVHALIAAAADEHTTPEQATKIDTVYMSICALSTMLDSLIDHEHDERAGQIGYTRYYDSHDQLAWDLADAARRAKRDAAPLKHGAHHYMTLAGVVAYYASAPAARTQPARSIIQRIERELQPILTSTLLVMRAWRTAKRIRHPDRTQ